MAVRAAARRLTHAHRLAQVRLGAQTVSQMLSAWSLLDPEDLDGTVQRWLNVTFPIVSGQRRRSSQMAVSYMTAFRAIQVGISDFRADEVGDADPNALATSLTVTGPIAVKIAMGRGEMLQRALDIGESMSAAAAMRYALDAGRETLLGALRNDPVARGWTRVTSGNACDFCESLAGDIVFGTEEAAGFQSHDACACEPEPVYDESAAA